MNDNGGANSTEITDPANIHVDAISDYEALTTADAITYVTTAGNVGAWSGEALDGADARVIQDYTDGDGAVILSPCWAGSP